MARPEPQAIIMGSESAHLSLAPKKTLSLKAPAATTAQVPAVVPAEIAHKAPVHWPADVRAEFAKATPLWQQFMVDRMKGLESGYTKRSQELADERKAFDESLDRWRSHAVRLAEIRGAPVEIDALIENLLEFAIAVEATPPDQRPALILSMAGSAYGLPVAAFVETIMQAGTAARQADAPARQAAEQAISDDIVAFAGAIDADGQLLRPHFAEVENEMRDLAHVDRGKGLQPDLGDLYSRATRLNPVVSARIAESERRQAVTQRDADERERIAKAKAANGSISGAGGGSTPTGGSVAEILDRVVPDTGW